MPPDRVQGVAVLHCAGNHHRVNSAAGGEDVGVSRELVAFVVVGDGIRECQRVGGVGVQGVFEIDDEVLSPEPVLRRLYLWRREEYVAGLLHDDVLVEGEGYRRSLYRDTCRAGKRNDVGDVWRNGILLAAGRRLRGVRAGRREQERAQHGRDCQYQWDESLHN